MSTVEEKPSTAVTVVERAALALGADEGEKELIALSKKYVDIVEIKNPAGRQQCHAAAMELGNARIATKKTGEAAREDANKFQKAVIAEVNRRIEIVAAEEARLLALRDAWDQVEEAKKIAKALAESQRITKIRLTIDTIRHAPTDFIGKSSAEIGAAADGLSEQVIALDFYLEFTGEAISERDAAVKQLRTMQEAMRLHEAEQQRLADERAALAQKQAELVEQERLAGIARAEQEAADKAERDLVQAQQLAAALHAEAVMLAERQAHEARMTAQQEELNRKQAVIDAAIAEQERIAREAREAAEAEERRQREVAEAAERAEAERVQAEKDAAAAAELAEAVRQMEVRQAAEAEAARRVRVQFETVGPEADEILSVLAEHYAVHKTVACNWLYRHAWAKMEVAA